MKTSLKFQEKLVILEIVLPLLSAKVTVMLHDYSCRLTSIPISLSCIRHRQLNMPHTFNGCYNTSTSEESDQTFPALQISTGKMVGLGENCIHAVPMGKVQ